jgi:PAS domain S-box-containing protein
MDTDIAPYFLATGKPLVKEAFQPYAFVLAVDIPTRQVMGASENLMALLGKNWSHELGDLLREDSYELLQDLQDRQNFTDINPFNFFLKEDIQEEGFEANAHRAGDTLYLEMVKIGNDAHYSLRNPYKILKASVTNIQKAEQLKVLCQQIALDFYKLTGYDRVMVYQFDEAFNWQVFAESLNGHLTSMADLHFPHTDIGPEELTFFKQGHFMYVPDTFCQLLDFWENPAHPHQEKIKIPSMICKAPPTYYTCYLHNMAVGACLQVPVMRGGELWGLITCHHHQPCFIPYEALATCELLSQVMASQILLLEEAEHKKMSAEKGFQLNYLIENLSSKPFFGDAIAEIPNHFMDLVHAKGFSLTYGGSLHRYGETPPAHKIWELVEWLSDEVTEYVFCTDKLAELLPGMLIYQKQASGIMAAAISRSKKDYMIWYRPEFPKLIKWAGEPYWSFAGKQDPLNVPQSYERKSFSPWNKNIYGRSAKWSETDIYYIGELRKIITESIFRQVQENADRDAKFRLMFQNSSDIQLILESDMSVRYISDSVQKILGYDAKYFFGNWSSVIHPEDLSLLTDYFERVKDDIQYRQPVEYRVRHKDGGYLYFETIASNFLDHPSIRGIICNSRDVTVRITSRNNLKTFQRAIEATPNGVLILDANNDNYPVIYVNKGFTQITGYSKEETLGFPSIYLEVHDDNWQAIKQVYDAMARYQDAEVLMKSKRKDDTVFWNQMQVAPIYDEKRNVTNYVVIITDFTFRKTSEEKLRDYADKLRASNEELQTFAYVASHDLQEPLRTIAGFSELLGEMYEGQLDAEANEYLEFILNATKRMKDLIQDLLQFSRVSTDKGYLVETHIGAVIQKTMENLHTLIEESQAKIYYEMMPVLMINETLIIQVFQNLISNAIKYRSERPVRIDIGARQIGNEWLFSVKDNGIGIEERFYDKIFVIFQRLHTKEEYSGTGIGLAICKKIVEKYGGKIWVESEIGTGSTFFFTLPEYPVLD